MRCTLLFNDFVSKPIQPSIEVQDSDPKKAVETKGTQSSRSGKLRTSNFTHKGRTQKYLTCSLSFYFSFFFANLCEGLEIK